MEQVEQKDLPGRLSKIKKVIKMILKTTTKLNFIRDMPVEVSEGPILIPFSIHPSVYPLGFHVHSVTQRPFNPVALRTAKTLWSFGLSVCNKVKMFS